MDPPADGMGLQPEKLEEEKESGPLLHCDLCDADIVYKIAQGFLPGLASACIDNTTGGLFKTPANVAAEIRKEMVDYLIQRSENFVAESVVLEGASDVEVSVDPYDTISDFIDDFVGTKRNFFSRVSGWLLSDKREDWIEDLVQEMELNGFWLLNRRNTIAQSLLKNLDFKDMYHCNMNFKSVHELEKHKLNCSFRTMTCSNEGCDSSFSAAQMDHHDSICPFKMLPCEQNCPEIIMRREMDRHCITICPMKLVKCPFYSVGCKSTVPQGTIEQHRSESFSSHLLYVLQILHKDASPEDLKERINELEKLSSPGRLAVARDARSLTSAIKDLEAKLGPLKVNTDAKREKEDEDLNEKNEDITDKPHKHVRFEGLPTEEEEATVDSYSSGNDQEDSVQGNKELMESSTTESGPLQANEKDVVASIPEHENLEEPPFVKEESLGSPVKVDEQMGDTSEEEMVDPINEENSTSPINQDYFTEAVDEKEKHAESTAENEKHVESSVENEKYAESTAESETTHAESSSEDEKDAESTAENETTHAESTAENETTHAESSSEDEKDAEPTAENKTTHAESSSDDETHADTTAKEEKHAESTSEDETHAELTDEKENHAESSAEDETHAESTAVEETHAESTSENETHAESTAEKEKLAGSTAENDSS